MKLYITADFNDADYGHFLINIDEETFNKFKPLIDAINNFKPYVRHSSCGGVDYHNWYSMRHDLGELKLTDKYSQFSTEYFKEFEDIFINHIPTPCL